MTSNILKYFRLLFELPFKRGQKYAAYSLHVMHAPQHNIIHAIHDYKCKPTSDWYQSYLLHQHIQHIVHNTHYCYYIVYLCECVIDMTTISQSPIGNRLYPIGISHLWLCYIGDCMQHKYGIQLLCPAAAHIRLHHLRCNVDYDDSDHWLDGVGMTWWSWLLVTWNNQVD